MLTIPTHSIALASLGAGSTSRSLEVYGYSCNIYGAGSSSSSSSSSPSSFGSEIVPINRENSSSSILKHKLFAAGLSAFDPDSIQSFFDPNSFKALARRAVQPSPSPNPNHNPVSFQFFMFDLEMLFDDSQVGPRFHYDTADDDTNDHVIVIEDCPDAVVNAEATSGSLHSYGFPYGSLDLHANLILVAVARDFPRGTCHVKDFVSKIASNHSSTTNFNTNAENSVLIAMENMEDLMSPSVIER